ncbi:MAG TPA: hypothetical protein PKW62_03285, partial [Chitinophagaceae bacterium]|nr:hypothetical protein [Chitinophagaceae bacterium]
VTYTIAMAVPLEAGEYEVDFSFVWGNRVISNVVTINFEIKPNYRVRLECSKTSIKWAADTDIEIKVKNEGDMTWPEGRYSLEFDLSHAPSGAKTADLRCFDIKPRVVETWEGFESGNYDAILIRDFKLPATKGDYRVKVYLLKDGKRFQASGNPKEFTFRIN